MDWNEDYCTDITYTYGYYGEQNPTAMRFMMLQAGLTPPAVSHACELGYGQGISINIHAASESVAWWGTDFNPAQAAFARRLGNISGARCYADSFEDFAKRPDLPEFDFITIHGIWTWIAEKAQQGILEIIDKKLRPGGVVYISYNTTPGWSAFHPARDLMKLYTDSLGVEEPRAKAKAGFAFLEKLFGLEPVYVKNNPEVAKRVQQFQKKDAGYLVHEFFNGVWKPVSFAEMAAIMNEARMTYACSAMPLFNVPGLGLKPEQRQFIAEIKDPVLRETVVDFMRNTQFRKDYWIKGAIPMGAVARAQALRAEQVILTAPLNKLTEEVKTPMGNLKLSAAGLAIMRAALADGAPHTLAELENTGKEIAKQPDAPEKIGEENLNTIAQACCALLSANIIAVARKKGDAANCRQASDNLNNLFENMALQNDDISFLASPVTGGGVGLPRFERLYLLALRRGAKNAGDMARFAVNCLNEAGQKIVHKGNVVENQDEALQILLQEATEFETAKLPILKNLMAA